MVKNKNVISSSSLKGGNEPGVHKTVDEFNSAKMFDMPVSQFVSRPNPIPAPAIIIKDNFGKDKTDSIETKMFDNKVFSEIHTPIIPKVQKKSMGVIFYTSSDLDEKIARPVREQILKSGLPIISTSLKSLDFGRNIVVGGKKGYVTMMLQIITALEESTAKYVFFTEHDVLYPPEHFDFTPPRDDIFYYNANNYRWELGSTTAIRHDRMLPLSVMCCNRKLALKFYQYRWQKMEEIGMKEFDNPQSSVMRKFGFEPGTKKKKRGGLTDDDFDTWYSKEPVIDIRHKGTFSPKKCTLESFTHKPSGWKTININELPICQIIR